MPDRNGGQGSIGEGYESSGIDEQANRIGQRVQAGFEEAKHRTQAGAERIRLKAKETYGQAERLIGDNPTLSVLVAAGVGFGVGFFLSSMLLEEPARRQYDRMADKLTRYVSEAINRALPESLAQRFPS